QRTCVDGYVKNLDRSPAAGVGIEAFAGSKGTTDAQGYYHLDASPNSSVRVVATRVTGTNVESREVEVFTHATGASSCDHAPDITMDTNTPGRYEVFALVADSTSDTGERFAGLDVSIDLVAGSVSAAVSGAKVEVDAGAGWRDVPLFVAGQDTSYSLF